MPSRSGSDPSDVTDEGAAERIAIFDGIAGAVRIKFNRPLPSTARDDKGEGVDERGGAFDGAGAGASSGSLALDGAVAGASSGPLAFDGLGASDSDGDFRFPGVSGSMSMDCLC